ncbi:MAG: hypothetical protein HGA62_04755 [Chlorobiaceae bacterium]|nr:hypothetical protein [Chlorobiaceae bacterium]
MDWDIVIANCLDGVEKSLIGTGSKAATAVMPKRFGLLVRLTGKGRTFLLLQALSFNPAHAFLTRTVNMK